ncbi:hypothetical protein GCM10009118_20070 [Wandonia haliotis]|uniref:Uncharacterized protein n=1 Tax=Wandonia haliotis TaxID=574963 RepID=A0ABN1MQM4_9FLAO
MKQEIKICDECESEYFADSSEMMKLCPECSHYLYGYENCNHVFSNGRCTKCYWNGVSSDYVNGLKSKRWTPISLAELKKLIESAVSKMTTKENKFWNKIAIRPIKWKEIEYGEEGNGFWVVGIFDNKVIWYNEIEEGFNVSTYSNYGEIDEYSAEQDELQWTIKKIKNAPQQGV